VAEKKVPAKKAPKTKQIKKTTPKKAKEAVKVVKKIKSKAKPKPKAKAKGKVGKGAKRTKKGK
jgi:hypothetical protein